MLIAMIAMTFERKMAGNMRPLLLLAAALCNRTKSSLPPLVRSTYFFVLVDKLFVSLSVEGLFILFRNVLKENLGVFIALLRDQPTRTLGQNARIKPRRSIEEEYR